MPVDAQQHLVRVEDRIATFSVDLVPPGRLASRGQTTRKVLFPEPLVWRFGLELCLERSPSHQGLYNRLKNGSLWPLNLDWLNLWRIPADQAVNGVSLTTDYLELITNTDNLELDQYAMYANKLVQVAEVGSGVVRVQPRPDVTPDLGVLQTPRTVDVWMPLLTTPATRRGTVENSLTIQVQTL